MRRFWPTRVLSAGSRLRRPGGCLCVAEPSRRRSAARLRAGHGCSGSLPKVGRGRRRRACSPGHVVPALAVRGALRRARAWSMADQLVARDYPRAGLAEPGEGGLRHVLQPVLLRFGLEAFCGEGWRFCRRCSRRALFAVGRPVREEAALCKPVDTALRSGARRTPCIVVVYVGFLSLHGAVRGHAACTRRLTRTREAMRRPKAPFAVDRPGSAACSSERSVAAFLGEHGERQVEVADEARRAARTPWPRGLVD